MSSREIRIAQAEALEGAAEAFADAAAEGRGEIAYGSVAAILRSSAEAFRK